ncbi:MAG: hypothetical protein DMD40_03705 [Gemmatimonadetes bacterium]|nr:MAG: hypothetical protein DMD40_03705 [Gemmatimonadota bacterium]
MADVTGVLRDIIERTLSAQPDIQIVSGRPSGPARLGEYEPDVIVTGLLSSDGDNALERLFDRYPHARVLGIADDGRHAYMTELRPHRVSLGELSPEQLVEVIRRAGVSAGISVRATYWE